MGLRDKVALALVLTAVLLQAAHTNCKPQSLRQNPFERYVNNDGKGKFTANYMSKESQYYNNYHRAQKEVNVSPTFYKTFNFPEVEFPSDTSRKESFVYNPGLIGTKKVPSDKMFDSALLNSLRKEARIKRKSKKQVNTNVTPERVLPTFELRSQPFYTAEMGAFPEVEYPLSAKDAWTPKYWNTYNTDDPFIKQNDYAQIKLKTKKDKFETHEYIKPSSMKENEVLFEAAKKPKEKPNKEVTTINTTDNKNSKLISTSKSKIETKISNGSRNTTISNPSSDRPIRLKPKNHERITASQRKHNINGKIKSKSIKSRSQLKSLATQTPYFNSNSFNCSGKQSANNSLNACYKEFTNITTNEISTNDDDNNNNTNLNSLMSFSLLSNIELLDNYNDSLQSVLVQSECPSQVICDSKIPNTVYNIISNNLTRESLIEPIAYNQNLATSETELRNDEYTQHFKTLNLTGPLNVENSPIKIIKTSSETQPALKENVSKGASNISVPSIQDVETLDFPTKISLSVPEYTIQESDLSDKASYVVSQLSVKQRMPNSLKVFIPADNLEIHTDFHTKFDSILDTSTPNLIPDDANTRLPSESTNLPVFNSNSLTDFIPETQITDHITLPEDITDTLINTTDAASSGGIPSDNAFAIILPHAFLDTKRIDEIADTHKTTITTNAYKSHTPIGKVKPIENLLFAEPAYTDSLVSNIPTNKMSTTLNARVIPRTDIVTTGISKSPESLANQEFHSSSQYKVKTFSEMIPKQANILQAQLTLLSTSELRDLAEKILAKLGPVPKEYGALEFDNQVEYPLSTEYVTQATVTPENMDSISLSHIPESIKLEELTDRTLSSKAFDLQSLKLPDKNITLLTEPFSAKFVMPPNYGKNNDLIKTTNNPRDQSLSTRIISDLTALHGLVESILTQVGQVPKKYISNTIETTIETDKSSLPTDYVMPASEIPDELNSIHQTVPTDFVIPDSLKLNSNDVDVELIHSHLQFSDQVDPLTVPTEIYDVSLLPKKHSLNKTFERLPYETNPTVSKLSKDLTKPPNKIEQYPPEILYENISTKDKNKNDTLSPNIYCPLSNLDQCSIYEQPESEFITNNTLSAISLMGILSGKTNENPAEVPEISMVQNYTYENLYNGQDPKSLSNSKVTEAKNITSKDGLIIPEVSSSLIDIKTTKIINAMKLVAKLADILNYSTVSNNNKLPQPYNNNNPPLDALKNYILSDFSDNGTLPDIDTQLITFVNGTLQVVISNNDSLSGTLPSTEKLLYVSELLDISDNETQTELQENDVCKMIDNNIPSVLVENYTLSCTLDADNLSDILENETFSKTSDNDKLIRILPICVTSDILRNESLCTIPNQHQMLPNITLTYMSENDVLSNLLDYDTLSEMTNRETLSDLDQNYTLSNTMSDTESKSNDTEKLIFIYDGEKLTGITDIDALSTMPDNDTQLDIRGNNTVLDVSDSYTVPENKPITILKCLSSECIPKDEKDSLQSNFIPLWIEDITSDSLTINVLTPHQSDFIFSEPLSENIDTDLLTTSTVELLSNDFSTNPLVEFISTKPVVDGMSGDLVLENNQTKPLLEKPQTRTFPKNMSTPPLLRSTFKEPVQDDTSNTALLKSTSIKSSTEKAYEPFLENNSTELSLENTSTNDTSSESLLENSATEKYIEDTSTESLLSISSIQVKVESNSSKILPENYIFTDSPIEKISKESVVANIRTEPLFENFSTDRYLETIRTKPFNQNLTTHLLLKSASESLQENLSTNSTNDTTSETLLFNDTIESLLKNKHTRTNLEIIPVDPLATNSEPLIENISADLFIDDFINETLLENAYSLFENNSIHSLAHSKDLLIIIHDSDVPQLPPVMPDNDALLDTIDVEELLKVTEMEELPNVTDINSEMAQLDVLPERPVTGKPQGITDTNQLLKLQGTNELSDTFNTDMVLNVTDTNLLPKLQDSDELLDMINTDALPTIFDNDELPKLHSTDQFFDISSTSTFLDETNLPTTLTSSEVLLTMPNIEEIPDLVDTDHLHKPHSTDELLNMAYIKPLSDVSDTELPTKIADTDELPFTPHTEYLSYISDTDTSLTLHGTKESLEMADKDPNTNEFLDMANAVALPEVTDTSFLDTLSDSDLLSVLPKTEKSPEISHTGTKMLFNVTDTVLLTQTGTKEPPVLTDTGMLPYLPGTNVLSKVQGTNGLLDILDMGTLLDVTNWPISIEVTDMAGTHVLPITSNTGMLRDMPSADELLKLQSTDKLLNRADTDTFSSNLPMTIDDKLLNKSDTEKLPAMPDNDDLPKLLSSHELLNMADIDTLSDMTKLPTIKTGTDMLLIIDDTGKLRDTPDTDESVKLNGSDELLDVTDIEALSDVTDCLNSTELLQDIPDTVELLNISDTNMSPKQYGTGELLDMAYNAEFSDVTDNVFTMTGTDLSQVIPSTETLPDVFPKVQNAVELLDISASDKVAEISDTDVLSEVSNGSSRLDLFDNYVTPNNIPTIDLLPEMQSISASQNILFDSDTVLDTPYREVLPKQPDVDALRTRNNSDSLPDSLNADGLSDMPNATLLPEIRNHVALPVKLEADILPNRPDTDALRYLRYTDALTTLKKSDNVLSRINPENLQDANASQRLPVNGNIHDIPKTEAIPEELVTDALLEEYYESLDITDVDAFLGSTGNDYLSTITYCD